VVIGVDDKPDDVGVVVIHNNGILHGDTW
jgi:hypothetical protein